jgi:hypothetical protein
VRPAVVVLSCGELSQVVGDNPYPDETNPKCLHAVFTRGRIGPGELEAIATAQQWARPISAKRASAPIDEPPLNREPADGSALDQRTARRGQPFLDPNHRAWNPTATVTALVAAPRPPDRRDRGRRCSARCRSR